MPKPTSEFMFGESTGYSPGLVGSEFGERTWPSPGLTGSDFG